MTTFISILLAIFFVSSIGKIFFAAIDAKQDDDLYKKQEQKIAELQKRIKELEDK